MTQALTDTSTLIDVLRNYPPARTWFATQTDLGLSVVAYMEVLAGARTRLEQQNALKFLAPFELFFLNEEDFRWAMEAQISFSLAYGISVADLLIASLHLRLQIPLYSRNLKHFRPLLGNLVISPY
jgi:predicted nucleic acid-binding protein